MKTYNKIVKALAILLGGILAGALIVQCIQEVIR